MAGSSFRGGVISSDKPLSVSERSDMQIGSRIRESYKNFFGDKEDGFARYIMQTEPYQNAYDLFSSDKLYGDRFLRELEMIPYSVAKAESTLYDDLGFTNNAADIDRSNFNYCIQQIQNLVQSYYEFINSLPSSQVSQLRDVGVNSAITGQGLQGSSLGHTAADSSALAQLRSTQPIDVIAQIANMATSVTGGISSIATGMSSIFKNISDMNIAREDLNLRKRAFDLSNAQGLSGIVTSLANAGFDLQIADFSTVEGVIDFLGRVSSDPKMLEIANNTLAAAGKSVVAAQPWRSAAYLSDTDKNPILDGVYKAHRSSPSQSFDEFFSSIASYEADIMYLETMRNRSAAIYDADVTQKLSTTDGASDAAAAAVIAENKRQEAQDTYDELVNSTKYEYLSTWLREYKNTKDPAQKFMILQTIYDLGLIDMVDYDLIEKTGSPILTNVLKQAPDKILNAAGMFLPAGKASKVAKAIGRKTTSRTSGPKGETVTETISTDIY